LGEGLLISTGDKWRNHRKLIAPTFHLSVLKSFVPFFYANSLDLVKKLRNKVGKDFDCHEYMSTVTVDILMETAMGVRGSAKEKSSFAYASAVMEQVSNLCTENYFSSSYYQAPSIQWLNQKPPMFTKREIESLRNFIYHHFANYQ
jgi:cytochrome P450